MDCTFLRIEQTMKEIYEVPDYQREYVWQTQHVEDLLTDISENAGSEQRDPRDSDLYFIGSIVVFTEGVSSQKYVLIDGQQRLSTVFLIFCACCWRLRDLGEQVPDWLSKILRDVVRGPDGQDNHVYRLQLNDKNNQRVLELAVEGSLSNNAETEKTKSQQNLIKAFTTIKDFLLKEFSTAADITAFASNICENVGLVRIETNDLQKALIVFETLNDRGAGLDAFDLLKNLLYRNVNDEQLTDNLTEVWNEIKGNVQNKRNIRPMRFMRYFLVSIDDEMTGKPPTEKQAFRWFQEPRNLKRFRVSNEPLNFAKRIRDSSNLYTRFLLENVNHYGARSPALSSLNLLAGGRTRQHMGLLLIAAEKNISATSFEKLVRCIESVFFYSFESGQRSQQLEQLVATWTVKMKTLNLEDEDEFNSLLDEIQSDNQIAYETFYNRFNEFGSQVLRQKNRLKYVLGKYLQYSEAENRDSNYQFLNDLIDDPNNPLDIEHVYPQSPSNEAFAEFGAQNEESSERNIHRLANLLLMESSLQRSCSNRPYSEKLMKYGESKFWMVKKFARPDVRGVLRYMDSLRTFPTHMSWDEAEIEIRQDAYKEIAKQIWNYK